MAEDERSGSGEVRPPASAAEGAVAAALSLGAASRAAADAFLAEQMQLARKQAALAEVQTEELREEKRLRHWSLRVRHISDVMKLAFELSLALIFLGLVVAIGAAVWSASREDGLVIDAFTAPPDMAQRGVSGDVVASELLDRLTAMQNQTISSRAASSYAKNWDNDIKVEIPDTGVSVGEAYRFLVRMLGRETHISGEIYRAQDKIVLITRVSGQPGARWQGRETELDTLVDKAAGYVFSRTQPFRYSAWLLNNARFADADPVLAELATSGPASERPWALSIWVYPALAKGDFDAAVARAREAARLAPNLILAQAQGATMEAFAGHDEQALGYMRATDAVWHGAGAPDVVPTAAAVMDREAQATIGEELADFPAAINAYRGLLAIQEFGGSDWSTPYMMSVDATWMHDPAAARAFLGTKSDVRMTRQSFEGAGWNLITYAYPQAQLLAAQGDWAGVIRDLEQLRAIPEVQAPLFQLQTRTAIVPLLTLAYAHLGDTAKAWQMIGKMPLDCYVCLRARGQLDVLTKNWAGAGYWFTRAVQQAPSIPFAYLEWGEALLARGNLDGAIAKFAVANQKGPHFADPLEMWGEALIAKNRSDLALAKFAEADKYAPNWGRLHLKWGEALLWSGDKNGAAKQFATASRLDLSAADKSTLARMGAKHG